MIWAQALGHGTSAQKAELIALTQPLRWAKGKRVNIYTDSRYAFATVHVHGSLYKERGLLTAGGKDIKNAQEILNLLFSIWGPKEVAVVHCKGHQRGNSEQSRGNRFADQTARDIAKRPVGPLQVLALLHNNLLPQKPNYTEEEKKLSENLKGKEGEQGWLRLPDGRTFVPQVLGRKIAEQTHKSTHLGGTKLAELLRHEYFIPGVYRITKDIASRCQTCARVNPQPLSVTEPGICFQGSNPGEHWEVDFTELTSAPGGYKYLLVLVDTFSGWSEAYPTRTEAAQIVVKKLLAEILPRFGLLLYMGSDHGPAFIAQITQSLTKALMVECKLHCIYRPQSSGQVE